MAHLNPGLEPGSVIGGYRIESFVARGGMGVIYRATQLGLERTVAVKVVAPELAYDEAFRALQARGQAGSGLDHPNILPIYETGEVDGRLFLAMAPTQVGLTWLRSGSRRRSCNDASRARDALQSSGARSPAACGSLGGSSGVALVRQLLLRCAAGHRYVGSRC